MSSRNDGVVIMARGKSSRMGSHKGLLICPDSEGQTFVARIAACYRQAGIDGVVVCTGELVAAYTAALAGTTGFGVVAAPAGGETGLTVFAGWRALPDEVTHVWAHPVDLPLVTPATLGLLRDVVVGQSERVVRPVHEQVPGHPVIVPVSILSTLAPMPVWEKAPMRSVLAHGLETGNIDECLYVSVADAGVVSDFDQPSDFEGTDSIDRG